MQKKDKLEKIAKILTIVYLILSFLNIFLPDGLSARIYPIQEMYQITSNRLFAMLRWANDMSLIVLPIAIFYKKKAFNKIAMYVLPIIFIICIFSFKKYLLMYTNGYGEGLMNIRFFSEKTKDFFVNLTFRSIYLAILFLVEGLLIAYIIFTNYKNYKFENKEEIRNFILIAIGVFLIIMPIYAPSYLFGGYALGTDENPNAWWEAFKIGKFTHILWIMWIPLETFVLYKIFSKLNKDDAYIGLVCLSLALFFEFSGIYTCFGEIVTQRYPLQLCNLGSLTMLPIVLSKNKTLSRFALFVNAPGVLVAVALCDSANAGVTYIMNVHYIVEHTKVIVIPLLAYMLGIFEPVDKKSIKEIVLNFTVYYLFVFILGGIFTGIYYKTNNDYFSCNYLFMFNKESTTSIVGFTGTLFDIHYRLFDFFDISLIHPFIYVGFSVYLFIFFYAFVAIEKIIKKSKDKKQG